MRQGTDRILIQFPGLKDTKELKKLIGETAKLTFHEVHPSMTAEEAKSTSDPRRLQDLPERQERRRRRISAAGAAGRAG